MIQVWIPGEIVAWKRPENRRQGGRRTDAMVRSYMDLIAFEAVKHGRKMAARPETKRGKRAELPARRFYMIATFLPPKGWTREMQAKALIGQVPHTSKPDADNLSKLKDALTGIAWYDDAQVIEEHITKRYGREPGLFIRVEEVRFD